MFESAPETAGRGKTVIHLRFDDLAALADVAQCQTYTARALVSLEGHAVIALELPPCGGRVDAHAAQIAIADARVRGFLDHCAQPVDQIGFVGIFIERIAALAGAVACV